MRQWVKPLLLGIIFACGFIRPSCAMQPVKNVKQDMTYSNEWFTVKIPKGWEYSDSTWEMKEFDRTGFEMNISDSFYGDAWISIVRSTTSIPWESPKQAAEFSRAMKEMSP